jgi:hypothetical protein
VIAGVRASGCVQSMTKDPHEMGSKKGNVKIRRKGGRPQIIEKIGSPSGTTFATGSSGLHRVARFCQMVETVVATACSPFARSSHGQGTSSTDGASSALASNPMPEVGPAIRAFLPAATANSVQFAGYHNSRRAANPGLGMPTSRCLPHSRYSRRSRLTVHTEPFTFAS